MYLSAVRVPVDQCPQFRQFVDNTVRDKLIQRRCSYNYLKTAHNKALSTLSQKMRLLQKSATVAENGETTATIAEFVAEFGNSRTLQQ